MNTEIDIVVAGQAKRDSNDDDQQQTQSRNPLSKIFSKIKPTISKELVDGNQKMINKHTIISMLESKKKTIDCLREDMLM